MISDNDFIAYTDAARAEILFFGNYRHLLREARAMTDKLARMATASKVAFRLTPKANDLMHDQLARFYDDLVTPIHSMCNLCPHFGKGETLDANRCNCTKTDDCMLVVGVRQLSESLAHYLTRQAG